MFRLEMWIRKSVLSLRKAVEALCFGCDVTFSDIWFHGQQSFELYGRDKFFFDPVSLTKAAIEANIIDRLPPEMVSSSSVFADDMVQSWLTPQGLVTTTWLRDLDWEDAVLGDRVILGYRDGMAMFGIDLGEQDTLAKVTTQPGDSNTGGGSVYAARVPMKTRAGAHIWLYAAAEESLETAPVDANELLSIAGEISAKFRSTEGDSEVARRHVLLPELDLFFATQTNALGFPCYQQVVFRLAADDGSAGFDGGVAFAHEWFGAGKPVLFWFEATSCVAEPIALTLVSSISGHHTENCALLELAHDFKGGAAKEQWNSLLLKYFNEMPKVDVSPDDEWRSFLNWHLGPKATRCIFGLRALESGDDAPTAHTCVARKELVGIFLNERDNYWTRYLILAELGGFPFSKILGYEPFDSERGEVATSSIGRARAICIGVPFDGAEGAGQTTLSLLLPEDVAKKGGYSNFPVAIELCLDFFDTWQLVFYWERFRQACEKQSTLPPDLGSIEVKTLFRSLVLPYLNVDSSALEWPEF